MKSKGGDLKAVVRLLGDPRPDRRVAAAIVLGEVQAAEAVDALARMASSGQEALALPALEALEKIGSARAVPRLWECLAAAPAVREAATRAIAAAGEAALEPVRKRMKETDPQLQPAQHAALQSVLARLAGGAGISAFLEGLYGMEREAAARAALSMRQDVKGADATTRRQIRKRVEKFLGASRTRKDASALSAALKILGFLEEPDTVKVLLAHARKGPLEARVEALTAMRFALTAFAGRAPPPAAGKGLLELLGDREGRVPRTAMDTLANLRLDAGAVAALGRVAVAGDAVAARTACMKLAEIGTPEAVRALADAAASPDAGRAEAASAALAARPDAAAPLADALIEAKDPAARTHVARVLRPLARRIPPAARKKLARAAAKALASGDAADAILVTLRDADPDAYGEVVRAAASKAKQPERALHLHRLLAAAPGATAEDRYRLAALELRHSRHDPHPHARAADAALQLLTDLFDTGAPVGEWLLKDRTLKPEDRFYAGFHFVESAEDDTRELGQELLRALAKGSGKLARSAKNKLRTAGK